MITLTMMCAYYNRQSQSKKCFELQILIAVPRKKLDLTSTKGEGKITLSTLQNNRKKKNVIVVEW